MAPSKALIEKISSQPLKSAYLINYSEKIRAERLFNYLLFKQHSLKFSSFQEALRDIQRIEGEQLKGLPLSEVKKIVQKQCKQLSFNCLKPLVLMSAEIIAKELGEIFTKRFINSPNSRTFYLLASSLRKNSKLYRQFKEAEALVDLEPFRDEEFDLWIGKELQRSSLKPQSKEVVLFLREACECNADRAYQAVRQLRCYLGVKGGEGEKLLTVAHCREFFCLPLKETVWGLGEMISKGDFRRASLLLSSLLREANPFLVLGALNHTFTAKAYSNNPAQIMSAVADNNNGNGLKSLLKVTEKILRADSRLKHYSLGELNTLSLFLYELQR